MEKGYVAAFVCTCTRAVHLELVSGLSLEAFISAFRRFVNRRGLPTTVYSDHGTNFVGANREIQAAVMSQQTKDAIQSFTEPRKMKWKFSPVQSPHYGYGGLWEADVYEMKRPLAKIVVNYKLKFEELTTTLTDIEASLNSRPIAALDTLEDDGSLVLTPSHFLISSKIILEVLNIGI